MFIINSEKRECVHVDCKSKFVQSDNCHKAVRQWAYMSDYNDVQQEIVFHYTNITFYNNPARYKEKLPRHPLFAQNMDIDKNYSFCPIKFQAKIRHLRLTSFFSYTIFRKFSEKWLVKDRPIIFLSPKLFET